MLKKSFYSYKVFEHSFICDFKVDGFEESKNKPDFSVTYKKIIPRHKDNSEPSRLSLSKGYIQNKQLLAEIENGNNIFYFDREKISLGNKIAKIFHQPLAYLFFQKNYFIFHGSAFRHKGRAVIISGLSGSGKSETIFRLSKNHKYISDDIVVVKTSPNKNICPSGLPFVCQQGKGKYKLDDKRNRNIVFIDKEQIEKESLELGAVIFLNWSEDYFFEKLNDQEIFSYMIANSFRPLPSTNNSKSQNKYLSNISNISQSTDFYKFSRPKGNISDSVQKLLDFLDG